MRILLLGYQRRGRQRGNYEVRRLIQELKKRGHEVEYAFWRGIVFSFSQAGVSIKRVKGRDLKYYDYIIPRNPRFEFTHRKRKFQTFLSHFYRHYLLIVDYINQYHKHILNEKTTKTVPFYDKLFQHYLLSKHGLPVVPSLLYTGRLFPKSVYGKFQKPYVAKNIEGTRGSQVALVNKNEKLKQLINKFGVGRMLVQKFLPANQDFRVIVIGNKVIGGMKRTAKKGEFRSNFSLGGYVEKIKVSKEFRQLALKAAKVFNAEFAGVDILEYKGQHHILEINIFPGFQGFEEATKINVAQSLVAYIEKNYLWSIESIPFEDKKKKKRLLDQLYEIEKENKDGSLRKTDFNKEILNKELIIVKKESEPIAYLAYSFEKNILKVSRLVIKSQFIGQRIGRRLLQRLIKVGKNKKAAKVQAFVNTSNTRRQMSFRRAGFQQKKFLPGYFKEGVSAYRFEYQIRKNGVKNAK